MRFPNALVLFISSVVAASAILLVAFSRTVSLDLFPELLLFILLIIAASYLIVQDPAGYVVSSATTLFYAVIYLFTPITAFFVVALGYAIGNTLPRSWVTWRASFNGAQMGLSALLGSLVYRALGGDPGAPSLASQLLPSLLGPLTHHIANNFFVGFFISEVRRVPFLRTWVSFVREFLWSNLLSIPTALLIAVLYARVHHVFVLAFLVSLPFQRWAIKLYLGERNTYTKVMESLVQACELSLPHTKGHARRVADLSLAVGRELGLIERDIELIEYAALLHDVGMIGFDDILAAQSVYEDKRRLIDEHVRVGSEIVSELPRGEIGEMVLNHHAAFSASAGKGNRTVRHVSIGARIIALAEEVDSRLHGLFPYVEPHSPESVKQFVVGSRGSVFDPRVVDAFLRVVPRGESTGVVGLEAEETPTVVLEGGGKA